MNFSFNYHPDLPASVPTRSKSPIRNEEPSQNRSISQEQFKILSDQILEMNSKIANLQSAGPSKTFEYKGFILLNVHL